METRFIQFPNHFRKISNAVKWILSKEAYRSIFISFYLDNQTPEIGTASNPSGILQRVPNEGVIPNTTRVIRSETSPPSVESEDVNTYAEAKVREMEAERPQSREQPASGDPNTATPSTEVPTGDQALLSKVPVRSSTPILIDAAGTSQASLNALESGLKVVNNPESQLPELLPAVQAEAAASKIGELVDDEDCESSVYEAPMLPTHEHNVRFLADFSEVEKTAEETSSGGCPSLYGGIPGISESGVETSDHPDITILSQQQQPELVASTSRGTDLQLPDFSGRARAILKTYFNETNAFRIPPGQTAVAFTESQVYHLLRVLTDETLRMSHSTMERMILDAVRGRPTIAPSRTNHFKSRAQTPFRCVDSDSSDAKTGDLPIVDSGDQTTTDYGDLGDSSSFGESDSAGEMALISATFKAPIQIVSTTAQLEVLQQGSQETDRSSQDVTLSEVKEQTLKAKTKTQPKKTPKAKRQPQRGVPMREEFFAKIW